MMQRAIHKQPTAVMHKHHHHRALRQGRLVVLRALYHHMLSNVRFSVKMRLFAHKLPISSHVKRQGQLWRQNWIAAKIGIA